MGNTDSEITPALSYIFARLYEAALQLPIERAVIFGSGLGDAANALLSSPIVIRFDDIPGMPRRGQVAGHAGELRIGQLGASLVALFLGRFHLYQGFTAREVAFPVRVAAALGVRELLLTNAAGSLDPTLPPGSMMLITDHINFTGKSPLDFADPIHEGSVFVAMAEAYALRLRAAALQAAENHRLHLPEGVYVGIRGPHYETPAEMRMFAALGARAIGMSTVLETIAARALGIDVLGLSSITNLSGTSGTHTEVLAAAHRASQDLTRIVSTVLHSPLH